MSNTLFPLPLDPALKWAGGKRWQIPRMGTLWEPHASKRLVEPFCGGLSISLGLRPERALYNDINPHLMNFYRQVAMGLRIESPMRNDEEFFYQQRERFNRLVRGGKGNTGEAAGLFYYLNRTCFNGLCRFNRDGQFNVPFGKYTTVTYTTDFSVYSAVLRSWESTCGDFQAVPLDRDDFVYADPPYDESFAGYAPCGFSWQDQVRAAEFLARHSGPVVLVNKATDRIATLYKRLGFQLSYLDAPRRINSTGDRTPAREIVAVRNI